MQMSVTVATNERKYLLTFHIFGFSTITFTVTAYTVTIYTQCDRRKLINNEVHLTQKRGNVESAEKKKEDSEE